MSDAPEEEQETSPPSRPEPYDANGARPEIHLSTDLHLTITSSCEALVSDPNLYVRGHELVDILRVRALPVQEAVPDEKKKSEDRYMPIGSPKLRQVPIPTIRERLTRCACFVKYDGRAEGYVPTIPPDNVVSGVAYRGEYPRLRPIVGILEAPSVRADGSLIQTPGYDVRTGYLYEPSSAFPPIPDAPTQLEACKALRELVSVFQDFPFLLEAGRTAAVAALLTILARPAIVGSIPAFVVDANVRGAGKSRVTDVVGILATGRAPAKMNWPTNDEELEKILGAYAMRGVQIANFDNLTTPFGGAPLDRCLSARDTVELRILGRSEVPEVQWRAQVMATGNNVVLGGDTARRSLVARIETDLEHPEDRTDFLHPDLLGWVEEHRPELVVCALTVLRAFFAAGKPAQGTAVWGSFEPWAALIPACIVFAGGVDPMLSRPAVTDSEEPEKAALLSVIEGVARLEGASGAGLTARTMVDVLYTRRTKDEPPDGYDGLRDAIESLTRAKTGLTPSPVALGQALRRFRRRVVGGRSLDTIITPGASVKWTVRGQVTTARETGSLPR